jgi:hypothetical protein
VKRVSLALLAVLAGCHASGQLGANLGPTLHPDGSPGLELVMEDRLGLGSFVDERAAATSRADVVLTFGLSIHVGIDSRVPHLPWGFQVGGGWLRLGHPGAPWGWSALASLGVDLGNLKHPFPVVRLAAGPTYVRSQFDVRQRPATEACGPVGSVSRTYDQLELATSLRGLSPVFGLLGGRHVGFVSGSTTCR